jgi:hypothetical protein
MTLFVFTAFILLDDTHVICVESGLDAIKTLVPRVDEFYSPKQIGLFPQKNFAEMALMSHARLQSICKGHLQKLGPLGEQHLHDYFDTSTVTGSLPTNDTTLPDPRLRMTSTSSAADTMSMTSTSSQKKAAPSVKRQLGSALTDASSKMSPMTIVKTEPNDLGGNDADDIVKSSGKKLGGKSRSRISKPKPKKKFLDDDAEDISHLLNQDSGEEEYVEVHDVDDNDYVKPPISKHRKTAKAQNASNDIHVTLGALEAQQLEIVLHNFLEVLKKAQNK